MRSFLRAVVGTGPGGWIGTGLMLLGLATIGYAVAAANGLVPAGRVIVPAPVALSRAAYLEGDRQLALALDPPGGLVVEPDGRLVPRVTYLDRATSRRPTALPPVEPVPTAAPAAPAVASPTDLPDIAPTPAASATAPPPEGVPTALPTPGVVARPPAQALASPPQAPDRRDPPPAIPYAMLPVPADVADRPTFGKPPPGRPVRLVIPAIKVDTQVVNAGIVRNARGELEWETVPFVAAHYGEYTAPVGAPGNAVISGHVVTLNMGNVFRNLYRVKYGDRILAYTDEGVFEYEVARIELVRPTQVDVMEPTPDPTLTLITCGGEFDQRTRTFSHRLVVQAKLVGSRYLE